MVGGFG